MRYVASGALIGATLAGITALPTPAVLFILAAFCIWLAAPTARRHA
jgi:hypothetical protein